MRPFQNAADDAYRDSAVFMLGIAAKEMKGVDGDVETDQWRSHLGNNLRDAFRAEIAAAPYNARAEQREATAQALLRSARKNRRSAAWDTFKHKIKAAFHF